MKLRTTGVALLVLLLGSAAAAQSPTTRELERINWMQFREFVPARVDTVLVPLGTLEPHGVTANGAAGKDKAFRGSIPSKRSATSIASTTRWRS